MRIASIGNMRQSVPPQEYGGTQRAMAQLAVYQAVQQGHDVCLYASADSEIVPYTSSVARHLGLKHSISEDGQKVIVTNRDGRKGSITLRTTAEKASGYEDPQLPEKEAALVKLLLQDEARRPFDVIHSHNENYTIRNLLPAGLGSKTLTHAHTEKLAAHYGDHKYPVIAISDQQARSFKERYDANVAGVVRHGIDPSLFKATGDHAGYLAWIGRFVASKGADHAIEIARRAGKPLVMAGTVYEANVQSKKHFENDIAPHITVHDPSFLDRMAKMTPEQIRHEIDRIGETHGTKSPVIFVGPATDKQKQQLFGNALATLFPITWAEPFGLVMTESMACGTPVLAFSKIGEKECGAVKEVIAQGKTGIKIAAPDIETAMTQAAAAVDTVAAIPRDGVRRVFDTKWSVARATEEIDTLYGALRPPSVEAPSASLKLVQAAPAIHKKPLHALHPSGLFFFDSYSGLGHQKRTSVIANEVVDIGIKTAVASGTFHDPQHYFDPRAALIALPYSFLPSDKRHKYAGDDSRLVRNPDGDDRRDTLQALIAYSKVNKIDFIFAELWPFKRREEYDFLIDAVQETQQAKFKNSPLIISSMRDVLDGIGAEVVGRRTATARKVIDKINSDVDLVIAHSDPGFMKLDETIPFFERITTPVRYSGYVVRRPAHAAPGQQREKNVIVSAGSGDGVERLAIPVMQALMDTRLRQYRWDIVLGPKAGKAGQQAVADFIRNNRLATGSRAKSGGVAVHAEMPDLDERFYTAGFSFSYAGLNTTLEKMASGVPGVQTAKIKTNGDFDREQWDRLRRLNIWQMAHIAHPQDVRDPRKLSQIIEDVLTAGPPRANLDFDGGPKTAALISELLVKRGFKPDAEGRFNFPKPRSRHSSKPRELKAS